MARARAAGQRGAGSACGQLARALPAASGRDAAWFVVIQFAKNE
jgi:hypothetical protein